MARWVVSVSLFVALKSVCQMDPQTNAHLTGCCTCLTQWLQVVNEIDNLLAKQAVNMKQEEAATLRQFKQKLQDVST